MGIFDLFGKEPRISRSTEKVGNDFLFENASPTQNTDGRAPFVPFKPTSFQDVEKIIIALKENKPALVHLTNLKPETAIRVLDMISGAVFALDGGVYEVEKNIFLFSPSGIETH